MKKISEIFQGMTKVSKIFHFIGIASLVCYAVTYIGFLANKKILTLPFEIIYFFGILGTLIYLIFLVVLQTKRKRFRENTHLALSAVIFFSILVVLYLIAARHHKLFDITEDKKYSLSDQTIKVLQSLGQDVEILAFFKQGQEGLENIELLFEKYRYHSERVTYEIINPQERPTLTEKYNIEQFGEIVLRTESRNEKIKSPLEEEITNALLKITSGRVKKVAFLTGHGEPSLDDGQKSGYSLLRRHLELQNYQLSELLLLREERVPGDIDCLIIASPKKELLENEINALRDFANDGGSILFLMDPKTVSSFENFVHEVGFDTKTAMIVDPLSRVFGGNVYTPVTTQYIPHAVTNNFRIACFFPTARMVDVKGDLPEPFKGYAIAYTGPGSWAEFNLESLETKPVYNKNMDIVGPVPLLAVIEDTSEPDEGEVEVDAAVLRKQSRKARFIAIGDSNFIDNSNIGLSGNKDMFLNIVSWLTRDENLISIRKTASDSIPLFLNKFQQFVVFSVPVLMMPLLALGAGILNNIRLRRE